MNMEDIPSTTSTPGPAFKPGMRCESKRLYGQDGGRGIGLMWCEEMPEAFREAGAFEKWAEFAILTRLQLVSGKQKLHSIVIQSPVLKQALKRVMAGYPGLFFGTNPVEIEAPFKPFVHRWDDFVRACDDENTDAEELSHLKLLESILEPELREVFVTLSDFKAAGMITFDHLWAIFVPGTFIFSRSDNADCIYRLSRSETVFSDGREYLILHCGFVDYNGTRFGMAVHAIALPQFPDATHFSKLDAHPLDAHPEKDHIVRRLIERGQKFAALAGVRYKAYEGMAGDRTPPYPTSRYVRHRSRRYGPRLTIL